MLHFIVTQFVEIVMAVSFGSVWDAFGFSSLFCLMLEIHLLVLIMRGVWGPRNGVIYEGLPVKST